MNIKFKKTLSLSLLASMVITPTVAFAMNFNNESIGNVENNDLNARETGNYNKSQDNINFESEIAKVIGDLNTKYDSDNTKYDSDKTKNDYFSNVFNFDLGLKFELRTQEYGISAGNNYKTGEFNPLKKISFYNDNSIKNDEIMLDSPDFWKPISGDFKKDDNLSLLFDNTVNHSEKLSGNEHLNQLGSVKNITSTYKSNFTLNGKVKYNHGSQIAYSSEYWLVHGTDNYLKALPNDNIVNNVDKFFTPNSVKPQSIDRWVDVFSQEDSLKIFNMVFDNNYLPEAIDADVIKTSKDLNEIGKMIKFSEDFKVLKSINDLGLEIKEFNNNLETYKNNKDFKDFYNKGNVIVGNLNKGLFAKYSIVEIIKKLTTANIITGTETDGKLDLKNLIGFINEFPTHITSSNKEYDDLLINLNNNGLITNETVNNEIYGIDNIALLYNRIIGWLSVNNISFNINGVNHKVFENGIINNLNETLEIFTNNTNISLSKEFVVNEVKIERKIGKYDKNIFSENVNVNSTSIVNDTTNKLQANFLTDSNYKIAYSKDYTEKKIEGTKENLARSIPVPALNEKLSYYLTKKGNDVVFDNNDKKWEDVITHIKDNILNISGIKDKVETLLFNNKKLNDNKLILDWNNNDLLKFLDFEGTLDDNAKLLLEEKLTNQNFNDDDGIFYSITTIPNWNGKEEIIGNENYIGHYKETEQKAFIDSINKDGAFNIIEIEPIEADIPSTTGYFILKMRTMNTAYTENAEKYEWLMNNFDNVFSPIIDTKNENVAFVNKTTNKLVGYTMNWDYIKANTPIKKTINVRDEFFLNIENLAKSNSADIFNYEGIIFDNKTIEYKSEIKPKLDKINVLINQEREKIQKIEKNIETPNVLHIMSLIISLFVGIIIVSIITIKILQDKKIDKKLNSKGIKRSELKK